MADLCQKDADLCQKDADLCQKDRFFVFLIDLLYFLRVSLFDQWCNLELRSKTRWARRMLIPRTLRTRLCNFSPPLAWDASFYIRPTHQSTQALTSRDCINFYAGTAMLNARLKKQSLCLSIWESLDAAFGFYRALFPSVRRYGTNRQA